MSGFYRGARGRRFLDFIRGRHDHKTWTCGACGAGPFEFVPGWDAEAEAVDRLGAMPADPVHVCDDCYEPILRANGHVFRRHDDTRNESPAHDRRTW